MKHLAAVLTCLWASGATAQPSCDERETVTGVLEKLFGEHQAGVGLSQKTSSALVYEIWVSEKTGTWTILQSTPGGISCVMANGVGWVEKEPQPQGDPG